MTGDRADSDRDTTDDRADTSRGTTDSRFGRRRLLAAAGTAIAAGLAGCGYQPGGGELDWNLAVRSGYGLGSGDRVWRTAADGLVSVRNRSGRTYDFDADEWVEYENAGITVYDARGNESWSHATERQYAGSPAVADGTVFVPLEDGTVAAAAPAVADEDRDADGRTLWTTDRSGPTLELAAADGLVACVHANGLRCLDAADGAERFAVERSLGSASNADWGRDSGRNRGSPSARVAVADGRVWAASSGSDPRLYGFDAEGDVVADLALPAAPDWLLAAGETCLVHVGDALWGVDADGDRRFDIAAPAAAAPALGGERCYLPADDAVVAVDVAAGERAWSSDAPELSSGIVADADGVYARTAGEARTAERRRTASRGRTDCDLLAVGRDGEERWRAATPDEPDCSGELFLVDDRLVVLADGHLYGFRTSSGRRQTLL